MGKDLELAIKIGGKIDKTLGSAINNAQKQLNAFNNAAGTGAVSAQKQLAAIGKVANGVGMAITTSVATAGTKLVVDSVNQAIEYEKAMAGVAKVVDDCRDENGKLTETYHELYNGILDMSTEIPMTANDIASIVESAGQAGIAKDELLDFAQSATKMGIAFDSTAEQAGDWMAQWRTSMGLNQTEVETLADQINYLGNTSSENALKLSEVVSRVGALGKIAGLSGGQVAAIAASMPGVEAEIAATGIKNMTKAMTKGEAATKKQRAILSKLGFSAAELAVRMQKDAKSAILDLLSSIKRLPEAEQAAALSQYFGNESVAAIAPLLSNLDNLKEQFDKVGDSSKYAGSMQAEYEAASATTANKLQLLKNTFKKELINLGGQLTPELSEHIDRLSDKIPELTAIIGREIEKIIPKLSEGTDYFIDNSDKVISGAIKIAKAFLLVKFGTGTIKSINSVVDFIKNISTLKGVTGGIKAVKGAAGTFTEAGTAAETFGGTIISIAAPMVGVTAAVTAPFIATVGAAALASKAVQNYKQGLLNCAQKASDAANGALDMSKQTQTLSDYYNKWQELNNLRSNGQALAEDEAELRDVEQWFVDNYGEFVSAWEKKNGVLSTTVEYVKEYQDALNAAKYAELESSVTEAQSKVPEIQKEITNTEALIEKQKAEALQTVQMQGDLQTFQNKMAGLNQAYKQGGLSSEQYRQQRQGLISQNQELLTSYEKLVGAPLNMGDIGGAIDNLKNKNSELNELISTNSTQLDAYQQALSKYTDAAKAMVEMDFGMSFAEAAAQGSDKLPAMEKQLTNIMQTMSLIPTNKEIHIADDGSIEIVNKQLSDIEQQHLIIELEGKWITDLNSIGNVNVSVNADGAFSVLNTITGEIQTLQGIGATNLQVNANGNIDVLNQAKEIIATIDSKSAQINIDGQAYGLDQIEDAKKAAAGLENKNVNETVTGVFNGQPFIATAVDYQSKLQDVNKSQTVTGKFPGKSDIATAISYQSQLHDKDVKYTVTYKQNGNMPAHNASGTENWRGGLTYVNDQKISNPQEVIEHNGMRYWYEGKNVLANVPQGAKIYNAAESRKFIDGSHRNGLDRVPFDGYIAELHAGEQVLTAEEASDYSEKGLFAQAIDKLKEIFNRGSQSSEKGNSGSDGSQIVFSPTYQIYGSAGREEIREGGRLSYKDFKEFYERMKRDERRKAF